MRPWRHYSVFLMILALASCSNPSQEGPRQSHRNSLKASSPEEALSWLRPAERQAVEDWKTRLTKACVASEILGEAPQLQELQIDAVAYRAKVGPAFLISGPEGEFAVLSAGTASGTHRHSTLSNSYSSDGNLVHGIEVEMESENGRCRLKLFGQPIADLELFGSIQVRAHYSASKAKQSDSGELTEETAGGIAAGAFLLPVIKALTADAHSRAFVAQSLGIPEGAEAHLIETARLPSAAVQSITSPDSAPFSPDHRFWMEGPNGITARKAGSQTFLWTLETSGPSLVAFEAQTTHSVKDGAYFESSLDSVSAPRLRERSNKLAATCFNLRFERLRELEDKQASVARTVGPCRVFAVDFSDAILQDAKARRFILEAIDRQPVAQQNQIGDWQEQLAALLFRLRTQKQDWFSIYDPEGRSALLKNTWALYQLFESGLENTDAAGFLRPLLDSSLQWAKRGVTPSKRDLENLITVLTKSGSVLFESASNLIHEITYAPNQQSAAIAYGLSLSAEQLASVPRLRMKTKALGLSNWLSAKLDRVFQDRLKLDELNRWNASLDAALPFELAERTRDAGNTNRSKREKVIRHALDESWDDSLFTKFQKLVENAPLPQNCSYFHDLSSIADCIGLNKLSRKAGEMLAPDRVDRYVEAAARFKAHQQALEPTSSMMRFSVAEVFWKPVWKTCSSEAFATKLSETDNAVNALAGEKNPFGIHKRNQALEAAWKDCGTKLNSN